MAVKAFGDLGNGDLSWPISVCMPGSVFGGRLLRYLRMTLKKPSRRGSWAFGDFIWGMGRKRVRGMTHGNSQPAPLAAS